MEFLQTITTGTVYAPHPFGSLATFQPTSAPTINPSATSTPGATQHTIFCWYTLLGAGGQGVIESLPYEIGPVINSPNFLASITVPADGNYPAAANHWALYCGTLPNELWSQVPSTPPGAGTALGTAATVPNFPLTNNIGVNRSANNPATGIVGISNYAAGTGYVQRKGSLFSATWDWRSLFGVDQGLSGVQPQYEQYAASITKMQNVPFTISLLQPWSTGLLNTNAGIVYSTTYNVWYLDNTQTNAIVTIDRQYGGIPGPYNPVGGPNDTGVVVIAHFNGGLI